MAKGGFLSCAFSHKELRAKTPLRPVKEYSCVLEMKRVSRYLSRWKTGFSFPSIYLFGGWGRKQVIGKVLCLESWFFFNPPVLHSGFLSEVFKSNLEMDANESLYTTSQFTEHLHVFPVSTFIFAVGIWVDCRVWAKLSWLGSRWGKRYSIWWKMLREFL